jgi:hypothetical protein
MTPDRFNPRPGMPTNPVDNLIVPERPEMPEINAPPIGIFPIGPLQESLTRIEKKLDEIDRRLKDIESKI